MEDDQQSVDICENNLQLALIPLESLSFNEKEQLNLSVNSPSESNSITPRTLELGTEYHLNIQSGQLVTSVYSTQSVKVKEFISQGDFENDYKNTVIRLNEIEEQIATIDFSMKIADINSSELLTSAEAKDQKKQLLSEKEKLSEKRDELIVTYKSLQYMQGIFSQPEYSYDEVSEAVAYRIYRNDEGIEVKRFALIAEHFKLSEDYLLSSQILHPLEIILFSNSLLTLSESGEKPAGVICDILVRKNDYSLSTIAIEKQLHPETHSIVLWKEKNNIILVDPSNSNFSFPLLNAIKEVASLYKFSDFSIGMQGVLYGHGGKKVGRENDQSRDCIDIAVKILFELNAQTAENPKKSIKSKMNDTFTQLSTEKRFAPHFIKESNQQLRELRSSSTKERHFALKIARAQTMKDFY